MAEPPPPDLSLFGYDVLGRLGGGASSDVYQARQLSVGGRLVAVKLMKPWVRFGVEMLQREIEAIMTLRHPHIVVVHDAHIDAEPFFLVVELARPGPVDPQLGPHQAIRCGVKLCSALALAHEGGVIHSDIKPDNILWHGTEPLLGDFGTARLEAVTRFRDDRGHTPAWSPPWIPRLSVDRVSDVWSLAATIRWYVTGAVPNQRSDRAMPDGMAAVLAAAMPPTPDQAAFGPEPALELGRRLQRLEHEQGWEVTPFPFGGHPNWTPGPRSASTFIPTGDEHAPRPTRPIPPPVDPPDQLVDRHQRAADVDRSAQTIVVPDPDPDATGGSGRAGAGAGGDGRARRGRRTVLWTVPALALVGALVAFGLMLANRGSEQAGKGTGLASTSEAPADSSVKPDPSGPADSSASTAPPMGGTGGDGAAEPTTGQPAIDVGGDLVYASDQSGSFDLYLRRADGSVATLVSGPDDEVSPSLSPDGSRLVFESNQGGASAVYLLALGDGGATPRRLSPAGVESADPAWSPSGDRIAWSTRANGNWDIVVHDLATDTETAVVTAASDDRRPAWSSDGTQLAFRSDRTGGGDIYRLDLTTQSLVRLTDTADRDDQPALGPDGQVAFERWVDGDAEIFTVRTDEAPQRRTVRSGYDGAPAYLGDDLVYVARAGAESTVVLVGSAPGAAPVQRAAGQLRDLQAV